MTVCARCARKKIAVATTRSSGIIRSMRWQLYAIVLAGCGGSGSHPSASSAAVAPARPTAAVTESCTERAVVVHDGHEQGELCPADAERRGLVVVDLHDQWTPRLFGVQSD